MGAAPPAGPFLALDAGDARIGAAASDALGLLARPLATIRRVPTAQCLDHIVRLVNEIGARAIVIGLPVLESGEEGAQARRSRILGQKIQERRPDLPIFYQDERYTSAGADELMRARDDRERRARRDRAAGRSTRDEFAAAIILQEWLDSQKPIALQPPPPEPAK